MRIKALLFDLDGVLYVGEQAIPGAVETLAWVREQAIPHLFVTNTSSRSAAAIIDKLARMGITVGKTELLTPPLVAVDWLRTHAQGAVALFVPKASQEDFADLDLLDARAESGAAAVVVGDLGEAWDFATLNRAFRLLMAGEATLIALGMTRYWQAPDGLRLDAGPMVAALSYASGRQPLVLGKPAPTFFQAALTRLDTTAGETLMIGDDLVSDVGGAQKAGLKAVLVKTGKYRPEDMAQGITPDGVIDSVADLPRWWASNEGI